MVKIIKNLAVLLLIIVSVGFTESARKNSPLLVEDEGSRRNRPAGECFVFFSFQMFFTVRRPSFARDVDVSKKNFNLNSAQHTRTCVSR